MKFVKLPVAVEAVEVTTAFEWFKADDEADGAPNGLPALPAWLMTAFWSDQLILVGFDYMLIVTKAGKMRADKGDWIIQGVMGEIYPCPGDVFAATYREEKSTAPVVSAMPALTDSLREVLGTPVHTMIPLVRLLQSQDPTVKHRYEDEQAALLHWMLTLWFQHGDDWRAAAAEEIGRMREIVVQRLGVTG